MNNMQIQLSMFSYRLMKLEECERVTVAVESYRDKGDASVMSLGQTDVTFVHWQV